MITLQVTSRSGAKSELTVQSGMTLMEALRGNGSDELLALCGGCCSCATCHVYVDKGPEEVMKVASSDEGDLLDSSEYRHANSRLSCQIKLGSHHDGMAVRIAPEA
jgi:2Fe-2S ferredoxin